MRVAIVAECFTPSVNGVTNTVRHIAVQLAAKGHDVQVFAPAPSRRVAVDDALAPRVRVTRLASVAVPGYPTLRLAAPGVPAMTAHLRRAAPDVVHLAAPFVLGWDAVRAAAALRVPTVAVYQTDLPSFASRYGVQPLESAIWNRLKEIHQRVDRTLAPSSWSAGQLREQGIPQIHRWARGVDATVFHPGYRDLGLRRTWADDDDVVIGYVGRLAAEKQVEDLACLAGLPRIRLVLIGDGPRRARLARVLPQAHFAGWQSGTQLSRSVASMDVVVHPGERDTFGQTIQEAMASGRPVVAVARGGPLDLVEHGHTGLLYPPGRLDQLRSHVQWLVEDPDRRSRFGAQARELVRTRSWSRTTDLLLEHYQQVRLPTTRFSDAA